MKVNQINNIFTPKVKHNMKNIAGAALMTMAITSTVLFNNKTAPQNNMYNIKDGNALEFFDKGIGSYGEAMIGLAKSEKAEVSGINIKQKKIISALTRKQKTCRVNFNQQVGEYYVSGSIDSVKKSFMLGSITIDNTNENTSKKYDLVFKRENKIWNITATDGENISNFKAKIEQNKESGKADLNIYDMEDNLIYSQNTQKLIISEEDYSKIKTKAADALKIMNLLALVGTAVLLFGSAREDNI